MKVDDQPGLKENAKINYSKKPYFVRIFRKKYSI